MKIVLSVGAFFALATVGAFLALIWTGDERWAQTGVIGILLTIVAGGIVGAIGETRD